MKLNRRKKRPLYFLSNKPPYISSLDGMKSQAGVYSINTQSEHHGRVQLYVTPSPTLDIIIEGVSTMGIKFCGELFKEAKNANNIF